MLKIFRRIRQRLLIENKFSKYLLYAIGEIVLVVIGILIAISLNSHYQIQSNKIERDTKLLKLRHVIYNDSLTFSRSIQNSQHFMNEIDSLQQFLDPEMEYETYKRFVKKFKEVNRKFRTFEPNSTVYNELINSASFSKIENQELKNNISTLYSYYDHFGELIRDFSIGFIMTNNNLYNNGIISYKYYNLDISEVEMLNGYEEFKTILNDPQQFRVLENYLYSERHFHGNIVDLYQAINMYYIKGLPVAPNK
jgi:hypothetical protein